MNIEISENLNLEVYGHSAIATNQNYVEVAFQLSRKMWEKVKTNQLKNKGLNIWIYDKSNQVFAGVELEKCPPRDLNLEKKVVNLPKYAFYKHVGSYTLLKATGQEMIDYLRREGQTIIQPYIEIYGHWTKDESKLETDLIMALK